MHTVASRVNFTRIFNKRCKKKKREEERERRKERRKVYFIAIKEGKREKGM